MTLVAILDYGAGNVHSVGRMLSSLGVKWLYTNHESDLQSASHIIMPGVGHCGQAMHCLISNGTVNVLNDLVLKYKVPVLGICLGMQLMTSYSDEGKVKCLDWFQRSTLELDPHLKQLKVPNIGWHTLIPNSIDIIINGIDLNSEPFYFCHRYGVPIKDKQDVVAKLRYGQEYAAILRKENIIGVQFHPEKSQDVGLKLFENFLSLRSRSISV
jgi:glutamine amidotransferase